MYIGLRFIIQTIAILNILLSMSIRILVLMVICVSTAMQVGFVNSLAFAKSGHFLVAGVGQVQFSECHFFPPVSKPFDNYEILKFCAHNNDDKASQKGMVIELWLPKIYENR